MDEDEFNFPGQAEDHGGFLDEVDSIPFEHRSFKEVLSTPTHALPRTVIPKVDGALNHISSLPALIKSLPQVDVGQEHHVADGVYNSVAPQMSHRWKPLRKVKTKWNTDETEKFYKVLEKFGTDLSLISLLFTGRPRTEVKKKLDFERKSNPERIFQAMNCVSCGDNDVDMAEFEKGVDDWEAYRSKPIVPLTQDEVVMLSDFQGTTNQEPVTTPDMKNESKSLMSPSSANASKEHETENNDFSFDDPDDFHEEDDVPISVQFGILTESCEEGKNTKKQPKKTKPKSAKEGGAKKRTRGDNPADHSHNEPKAPSGPDWFDFE